MSAAEPSCTVAFFPCGHFNHIDPIEIQQEFQVCFARWGLPEMVRVDNGSPWGSWGDLPTALALWLIGNGVEVIWNDAGRPQQNGVVERSQGTTKRWAEPKTCKSVEELQSRLDADDVRQREKYPHVKNRSRMEVYPGLSHSGRSYQSKDDRAKFRLELVLDHLSRYLIKRWTDKSGKVSIWNRNLLVSPRCVRQQLFIHLDPLEKQWVFADEVGNQVRTLEAKELTVASICSLQVAGNK